MAKKIKLVLLTALIVTLVLVIVQNAGPVHAHFLWLSADIPAVLLLFLTAAAGFISGLLAALLVKSGAKSKS